MATATTTKASLSVPYTWPGCHQASVYTQETQWWHWPPCALLQVPTHPWAYRRNDGWGTTTELGARGCSPSCCQGLDERWGNTRHQTHSQHFSFPTWSCLKGGILREKAETRRDMGTSSVPQSPPAASACCHRAPLSVWMDRGTKAGVISHSSQLCIMHWTPASLFWTKHVHLS